MGSNHQNVLKNKSCHICLISSSDGLTNCTRCLVFSGALGCFLDTAVLIKAVTKFHLREKSFSLNYTLKQAKSKYIRKPDGKVSTRSACQVCIWAFPPLVLSFCGARQRLNLASVGCGDIYLGGAFEWWISCPGSAWHTSHGASLTHALIICLCVRTNWMLVTLIYND